MAKKVMPRHQVSQHTTPALQTCSISEFLA